MPFLRKKKKRKSGGERRRRSSTSILAGRKSGARIVWKNRRGKDATITKKGEKKGTPILLTEKTPRRLSVSKTYMHGGEEKQRGEEKERDPSLPCRGGQLPVTGRNRGEAPWRKGKGEGKECGRPLQKKKTSRASRKQEKRPKTLRAE